MHSGTDQTYITVIICLLQVFNLVIIFHKLMKHALALLEIYVWITSAISCNFNFKVFENFFNIFSFHHCLMFFMCFSYNNPNNHIEEGNTEFPTIADETEQHSLCVMNKDGLR